GQPGQWVLGVPPQVFDEPVRCSLFGVWKNDALAVHVRVCLVSIPSFVDMDPSPGRLLFDQILAADAAIEDDLWLLWHSQPPVNPCSAQQRFLTQFCQVFTAGGTRMPDAVLLNL